MSGIERDVYLWSQPQTALKDFRVISTLDDQYKDGIFTLSMDLRNNSSQPAQLTALYELLDREGKVVATSSEQIHLKAGGVRNREFPKDVARCPHLDF